MVRTCAMHWRCTAFCMAPLQKPGTGWADCCPAFRGETLMRSSPSSLAPCADWTVRPGCHSLAIALALPADLLACLDCGWDRTVEKQGGLHGCWACCAGAVHALQPPFAGTLCILVMGV